MLGFYHWVHEKKGSDYDVLHKKKFIRFVDKLALFVSIAAPLTALPQIIQIFVTKDVSGISPTTWFLLTLINMFWFIYGVSHKIRPIIVYNALWVVLELVIVVSSIYYGAHVF